MYKIEARQKMNYLGQKRAPFLFIIDFDMKNNLIFELKDIDPYQIKYSFNKNNNINEKSTNKNCKFKVFPPCFDDYKTSFERVQKHISHGNSYLLNLTFGTRIETNCSLDDIFYQSNARYKLKYRNKFVFFSPEIFVQIKDRRIYSFPMKGTIDFSLRDAANKIMNDKKEKAEHFTVVDLIRNDLNIVAKRVRVDKFRYIERLKTNNKDILQVSSKISGYLGENYLFHIGDIIFSMLPAGSVSGAPKTKTLEIIKEAENYERGYYTGVAGIFDGENLDSCVMIRFIENIDDKYYYKSGGGITFMSDVHAEYEELLSKIYLPLK